MNIDPRILRISLIILIYGVINFYSGLKLFSALRFVFNRANKKIFIMTYSFFVLSFIMGRFPLYAPIKEVISWIGAFWIAVFVYLFLFFLVIDIVLFLGKLIRLIPSTLSPKINSYATLVAVLCTAFTIGYGVVHATQIKNVSYDIKLDNTTLSKPLKIVLISDLHIGAINSERKLEKVILGINEVKPDIVFIAGDIFNDNFNIIDNPNKVISLFQSINSIYGVYASLGNHDSGKTFNQMSQLLEKSHVKLLNDEYVIVDNQFVVVGRVDPSPIGKFGHLKRKELSAVLPEVETSYPIIVMDHRPSSLEQYNGSSVDLVLCGHTHKGQFFPINLITNLLYTVDYGYYRKDENNPQIVVTSGAGIWGPPLRIGTTSEIVSITLK